MSKCQNGTIHGYKLLRITTIGGYMQPTAAKSLRNIIIIIIIIIIKKR
jgi:hypothetical protein